MTNELSSSKSNQAPSMALTQSGSWPLARQLAQASAEAYRRSTVRDPRTDATANVTLNSTGDVIVAFKGSSEPEDFLQDAKFEMSGLNWPGFEPAAKAHTGFLEDINAIKEAVIQQATGFLGSSLSVPALAPTPYPMERTGAREPRTWAGNTDLVSTDPRIQSSNNPSRPELFITGHSLGGALAMLCALEFCRRQLPVSAVYTFGQPRVGNKAFAELYDSATAENRRGAAAPSNQLLKDITFRVVNQNDIVPRTPGVLLGYRHCGNELFLSANDETGWQLNPAPWSRAWSDLRGFYEAWRKGREVLVSDHLLPAYCRRLQLIN